MFNRPLFTCTVIIILVITISGCSEKSQRTTVAVTPVVSEETSVYKPSCSASETPMSEIESNTGYAAERISAVSPSDEQPLKRIAEYFSMTKEEILDYHGAGYETVPSGPEGCFYGYKYADIGLTFVFDYTPDDHLIFIDCEEPFSIDGAKAGMDFNEIQRIMGDTPVEKGWYELPENIIYILTYDIDDCAYYFWSSSLNGDDSLLKIDLSANLK